MAALKTRTPHQTEASAFLRVLRNDAGFRTRPAAPCTCQRIFWRPHELGPKQSITICRMVGPRPRWRRRGRGAPSSTRAQPILPGGRAARIRTAPALRRPVPAQGPLPLCCGRIFFANAPEGAARPRSALTSCAVAILGGMRPYLGITSVHSARGRAASTAPLRCLPHPVAFAHIPNVGGS